MWSHVLGACAFLCLAVGQGEQQSCQSVNRRPRAGRTERHAHRAGLPHSCTCSRTSKAKLCIPGFGLHILASWVPEDSSAVLVEREWGHFCIPQHVCRWSRTPSGIMCGSSGPRTPPATAPGAERGRSKQRAAAAAAAEAPEARQRKPRKREELKRLPLNPEEPAGSVARWRWDPDKSPWWRLMRRRGVRHSYR